jgi:hypothetical protein
MRSIIKNKKGAFTDLFLFMIFAFVIILVSVAFIYMGNRATDQLKSTMGNITGLKDVHGNNASVVVDNTFGKGVQSYNSLTWISVFLIFGMIIAIFIGSYLVTTKPIFFVPYLFVVIIAIVVSVPISNTYETLTQDATLSGTFSQFIGANFLMLNLPVVVTIVGFVGGIIMFSRMGRREEATYYA